MKIVLFSFFFLSTSVSAQTERTPIHAIRDLFSTHQATLSPTQLTFENQELNGGGEYTLSFNFPVGGGALLAPNNYIETAWSGGLLQSPSDFGSQMQKTTLTSLDPVLPAYSHQIGRILKVSQVFQYEPDYYNKIVSEVGNDVLIESFAKDGLTELTSVDETSLTAVPLQGLMGNSPDELMAAVPIFSWITANNFAGNAKWLPNSKYFNLVQSRAQDTIFVEDCLGISPTYTGDPEPCVIGAKLETIFPFQVKATRGYPPRELDAITDGDIELREGLRVWVSKAPIARAMSLYKDATQSYRVFYELNGNVYMGHLEKAGTVLSFQGAEGEVFDYTLTFNQAAIQSIQSGLITGTSVQATAEGLKTNSVSTSDLFGVGGHGPNGSISPDDIRKHYHFPKRLKGAGQTIAIVDGAGTGDHVAENLNVFSQFYGLPLCNDQNLCFKIIDLSNGQTTGSSTWDGETALDVQLVHGVAPEAKIILVVAASDSAEDLFQAVNYAAALPGVTVVSMSFENGMIDQINQNQAFLGFQKKGVIFFASSGDGGNTWQDNYPSSSPYVTAVGGTRINSVDWKKGPQSEVGWMGSTGFADSWRAADWLLPDWQAPALNEAHQNLGSRAVPDVSAVADYQYSAIANYNNGAWVMDGGTSAAAPIWAGIAAILGEGLNRSGKSLTALVKATPGGFNGILYQDKLRNGNRKAFHDIVSGSNNVTGADCSYCSAGPGYDYVTGLGSPDVKNLLFHLK